MTRQEVINKLKKHGIELVFTTPEKHSFDEIQSLFEKYHIPKDAEVPSFSDYQKIIKIVGKNNFCKFFLENNKHYLTGTINNGSRTKGGSSICVGMLSNELSFTFDDRSLKENVMFWVMPENFYALSF